MSSRIKVMRIPVLLLPLATLISACGGGGGGSSSDSSSTPTPPTISAPEVVSTTPADADTDVSRSANATATFDVDMIASSIDETSFTLAANSSPINGAVSYDALTKVATFDPTNELPLLATFTASLDTTISDLDGNFLASAVNWSFTTVDGIWGGSQSIDPDTELDIQPRLAVNADGTGFAVWEKSTTNEIYAARYTVAGGWEIGERISTISVVTANPQVAVDSLGNAFVVWNNQSSDEAEAVRFDAGSSSWGIPELLNGGSSSGFDPRIAVDSSGNGYAVWKENDGTANRIFAARYDAGTEMWGTPETLDDGAGNSTDPDIAADSSDNLTAVWVLRTGTSSFVYEVESARRQAGGNWGAAETIENVGGLAVSPVLGADGSGNVLVIWRQRISARDDLYANRHLAGIGWTPANATAISSEAANVESYDLAVDPAGNALAVWLEADNVFANRYSADSGWGAEELIETSALAAGAPTVAVDSSGNGLAVWGQSDGAAETIFFNRYVAGSGWAAADSIQTGAIGVTLSLPQVAVDSSNEALAVWLSANAVGPVNEVSASRFE